jgi:hypothetical protein
MKQALVRLATIILALSLAACAMSSARVSSAAAFQWTSPTKRIVLVPPDVQLRELTFGGVLEPRADWTNTAKGFIDKSIRDHFARTEAAVVDAQLASAREVQLAKLYDAVGVAILTHLYNDQLQLPNKGDALDWTLGPGTGELRDRYGADYALFVLLRDSYSSPGRQAAQVFGALLGVGVPGGVQVGVASLVDLRTGNIVWFNRLISTTGDLRTEAPATRAVNELLRDIPI